ncbi:hypothetical protein EVA_09301 [gut metagenome]|uniref:Uncharacterized protein n=1 Tax=gut metagenome TaxID=749906 RepID=J9GR80_9ZZZZ
MSPPTMITYFPGQTVEERIKSTCAAFTIKSLVSIPLAMLDSSTIPIALPMIYTSSPQILIYCSVTSFTTPPIPLCIFTESPSAACATRAPFSTCSPAFTTATAGFPICCDSKILHSFTVNSCSSGNSCVT